MQNDYTKSNVTALWILFIGVSGYAAGTTSVAGWTILLVLALTPPLVLRHFWRKPSPTLSESIHDVLQ